RPPMPRLGELIPDRTTDREAPPRDRARGDDADRRRRVRAADRRRHRRVRRPQPHRVARGRDRGRRWRCRVQLEALRQALLTPPAVVAQALGTLGSLYPGRMILGVGTGEHLNEGALGIRWPDNKERFARLREAVRLIRQLWTEQSVTFDGEYYHTKNATIYDRPDQPIPIYVGAGGPQVAKYAGRAGDGLICTSGKGMELYSEQLLPSFGDGAKESGRDAGTLDKMIEVKVSYDNDRARAMEDTKIWAALALPPESKAGIDDPREMERLANTVEDVAHRRWLV